ncbi:tyrosine-type recombinase/integrase [Microbacterium plantarum]|uniref:Tyrosine-type recombinase/integrase n=1 Tax=Microbacterium plantarum TaxID=1816425 RepID=A0ABV5EUC7_9MICO
MRQVERFAPSEAKAKMALRQALTSMQEAAAVEVKRETRIRDLGERFLTAKAGRAPRTVETYTRSVRKIIVPRIGDLAVSEATPERLQRFIDLVASENGPGEAKKARAVLSGMLGLATRSDALRTNPVRELAAIESRGTGATAVPLGALPALLEKVRQDEQLRAQDMVDLIEFVAGTGVRISEALGLDWPDVDLDAGAVTIRKSKTEAGERTIVVPGAVADMLRRRGRVSNATFVFPTPLGKRRDRHNTSAIWADARERLSLGPYTFHSFRKTVATALDQAGLTPRDIAEYLGHADPSLTMSVYMSKTVGGSRAADALDSVLKN